MGKFIVVALVAIVFVVALSGGDGTSAAAPSPAPAAGSATPSAVLDGGVLYPSQPAGQVLHSFTWDDAKIALALVGIDIDKSSIACTNYNEPGYAGTRYSSCAVTAPDGRSGTLYVRDGVLTAGN